jgi:hypothetical protein
MPIEDVGRANDTLLICSSLRISGYLSTASWR